MNKVCVECDGIFDPHSREKRRAGGLSTHCPECSDETSVRYLGISAGEGKQASVQVLKFSSESDRERYQRYWKASSGLNTGKNCQLGYRANELNISFETRATFTGNVNAKGKAD
jgi:hypothetical protein